jgi:hypothetical protein
MLDEVRERQHGVITRQQALAGGLTVGAIRAKLRSGRWRRLATGVYATFTGPLPRSAQLWTAVLASGCGAMLSHETAAELAGLTDEPAASIHVTVPADRRTSTLPGVCRHFSVRAHTARHPSRLPPQTRVEETVIDLTQSARDVRQAMSWVIRAVARRLTTVERLRQAFAERKKLRWRAELAAALEDVRAGCHSMLEVSYLRHVERGHGLPTADRQVARVRRGGRWYDDVHYRAYQTVVELDGRPAHPEESRGRDMLRDNAGVAAGLRVLRYGAREVASEPCAVALQIATVLQRNGWRGRPRPCGPTCMITVD